MNAWSHLPNARHIDRVLESLKSHSEIWAAARDSATGFDRPTAWSAGRSASFNAGRHLEWDAAYAATWSVTRETDWSAGDAAWDSVTSLIAYDYSANYLDMPSDQLRVWAIISEDPAAILLLPAIIAFERINELETV